MESAFAPELRRKPSGYQVLVLKAWPRRHFGSPSWRMGKAGGFDRHGPHDRERRAFPVHPPRAVGPAAGRLYQAGGPDREGRILKQLTAAFWPLAIERARPKELGRARLHLLRFIQPT